MQITEKQKEVLQAYVKDPKAIGGRKGLISYFKNNFGLSATSVNTRLNIIKRGNNDNQNSTIKAKSPAQLTEEEIRAQYDNNHKLNSALISLKKGIFYREADFRVMSGISINRFRQVADQDQYNKYHGKAEGGAIYWGHPESIQKLKEDMIFS